MAHKNCTVCGTEFVVRGKAKTCSVKCSKTAFNENKRRWRRQSHVIAIEREKAREYHQRPDVKKADRERDKKRRELPARKEYERARKQTPAHKEYMREYQHTSKRKTYLIKYGREYGQRPEAKAALHKRRKQPEVKEKRRLYAQRPDVKASKTIHRQKRDYKEKQREYYAKPDIRKRANGHLRRYRAFAKSEALAFARKLLSGKYPDLIAADHDPCLLYTAKCRKTGQILYIGITENWELRHKQHATSHKGALWLPTAEITMNVYPSRTLAMAAEMLAIKEHAPPFNVIHNSRGEKFAA